MLLMGIWVHPYTVMPLQVGVNVTKIGVGLSPSDVVMSWLRLQTPVDCIPHPYHILQSFLAPSFDVDGHLGALLHCYAFAGRGGF